MLVSFGWYHGLGDTANVCQLLPLWVRRGYEFHVSCTPCKEPLFKAVGCKIIPHAPTHHPWLHPPHPGTPTLLDGWSGNKTAWNLTQFPLPPVGQWEDLWGELVAERVAVPVPDVDRARVDEALAGLPRPLILFHPKGNTSPGAKNCPDSFERDLASELLCTGGTVAVLDWDNRCQRLLHSRYRHAVQDWHGLNVTQLYHLMASADLFIGVDSGPLHLARWTDTPCVGLWFDHYPCHFALPSPRAVHLVKRGQRWAGLNRYRRHEFNILEVDDLTGPEVAKWCGRVLNPPGYVPQIGPDVLASWLVDRCHHRGERLSDRDHTFDGFFRLVGEGVVVETGSIRAEEDFSAGFFGYICGLIMRERGGHLHTLELDPAKADFARKWSEPFPVTVHTTDSRPWLKDYVGPKLAGAYLDSADTDTPGYQECCLQEAQYVVPHLRDGAPILIDDSPHDGRQWSGKGALAIPWLLDKGWRVVRSGWQVLLQR